jgi:hypothetical protein
VFSLGSQIERRGLETGLIAVGANRNGVLSLKYPIAAYTLGEEETAHKRTLESYVNRASKPNKKITTAS